MAIGNEFSAQSEPERFPNTALFQRVVELAHQKPNVSARVRRRVCVRDTTYVSERIFMSEQSRSRYVQPDVAERGDKRYLALTKMQLVCAPHRWRVSGEPCSANLDKPIFDFKK